MDKLKRRQEMGKINAEILSAVDQNQIDELVDAIIAARRVFVSGWGRAGNIARILGMNMSQLGMNVFCVGDNNTPPFTRGICSSSSPAREIPRRFPSSASRAKTTARRFA